MVAKKRRASQIGQATPGGRGSNPLGSNNRELPRGLSVRMDKKMDDKKMMCPSSPSHSVGWFEKPINAQSLQNLIVHNRIHLFVINLFVIVLSAAVLVIVIDAARTLAIRKRGWHRHLSVKHPRQPPRRWRTCVGVGSTGGNQGSRKMPAVLRAPTIVRKRLEQMATHSPNDCRCHPRYWNHGRPTMTALFTAVDSGDCIYNSHSRRVLGKGKMEYPYFQISTHTYVAQGDKPPGPDIINR